MEHIEDRYSPWNFVAAIPWDIVGEMTMDAIVRDSLIKVARLRGWLNSILFGMVTDNK